MTLDQIETQKKILQNELVKNSKRWYKIIWAIFVTLVSPFLIPFLSFRNMHGKNFESLFGYWNSVMVFGGGMLLVMIVPIYQEYDKMKRRKFDIEGDIRRLEKERR